MMILCRQSTITFLISHRKCFYNMRTYQTFLLALSFWLSPKAELIDCSWRSQTLKVCWIFFYIREDSLVCIEITLLRAQKKPKYQKLTNPMTSAALCAFDKSLSDLLIGSTSASSLYLLCNLHRYNGRRFKQKHTPAKLRNVQTDHPTLPSAGTKDAVCSKKHSIVSL